MRLSGWLSTVFRKVHRGDRHRRSGRSDRSRDRAELRLYITQLEDRRVLSASPMGHAVMGCTLDGALSPLDGETTSEVRASLTDGNLKVQVSRDATSSQIVLQIVQKNDTEFLQIFDATNVLVAEPGDIQQVDRHTLRVAVADLAGAITVLGGDGDDTLTIDHSGGNPITVAGLFFEGGLGNDALAFQGTGTESGSYMPSDEPGTDGKKGTIQVEGRTIHFDGLEPIDVAHFASWTVNPAGADDVLTISDGYNLTSGIVAPIGSQPALVISGSTDGVAIETVALWDVETVTVNTATMPTLDGNDQITVTSGSGAHDVIHLNIDTGSGNDSVTITGSLNVGGDISIRSQNILFADAGRLTSGAENSITLDAGSGTITRDASNTENHLTARTLSLNAATGIGQANRPLHTRVEFLEANMSAAGSIYLHDKSGGISLIGVSTHDGSIKVLAEGGTLTVANPIFAGGMGDVLLESLGAGSDLVVNDHVTAATGHISLLAMRNVTQSAVAVTAGGTLDVEAQGGSITMADGGTGAAMGNARLLASQDVTLGGVSGANVWVQATGGSIFDGGDAHVDVAATTAQLVAGVSVGTPGAGAIDTTLATVAASAGTGNIYLSDTSDLTVGSVAAIEVQRVALDSTTALQAGVLLDGAWAAGHVKVEAALALAVSQAVTAGGGDLLLAALGGDLAVQAAVTAAGDASLLASANVNQAAVAVTAGGTLDVEAQGGSITMADGGTGAAMGNVRYLASQDVTLGGVSGANVWVQATRDIVVQALVHSGGNILLLADSDNSGQGGLWVQATGKVSAAGGIEASGSDVFRTIATESKRTEDVQVVIGVEAVRDGVRVDADNHHPDADQMVADGTISLGTNQDADLVLRGVIRTTGTGSIDLNPLGNIQLGTALATAGGHIAVPRPTLLIGDSRLTTNATSELTINDGSQDPMLAGDIAWVAGATIDSQVDQGHSLVLRSGTGTTTFNANIGETTALASLVIAHTTGRVAFGGADVPSGDLSPVTLVRTRGDIDVGRGVLDTDEVSGGIVLNGGAQPDAILTFRTLDGGNARFHGPVTLASDVVITTNGDGNTGTGQTLAGDITFTDAATVDSQQGEHNHLVLRAGTGVIGFGANVGETVTLQSLTVEDTTGGVVFGTADALAVDSDTGPVTLVQTEGDLILGAGPSDPGISGQIVFNGGEPVDELLVQSLSGAILIQGNVTLGSTTVFRHTGEASLSMYGGILNIQDSNSQLVIDALTDSEANAPTDANPTAIIESRIIGAGRLVKTGTGWLTLTNPGDNAYEGGTTIAGGTLSISKDGHLGSAPAVSVPDSIVIDGAMLYVRSDVPVDQLPHAFWLDGQRGISLGPAGGTGHGTIFVQQDVMVMYSGVVADNDAGLGALYKTGPGILMLNGLNTYGGTTYIAAGTLLINGSTSPTSTVYVGGEPFEDGESIGGKPIRVTEQYAMLGGVGVVQGNVYVLGMPEIDETWVLQPPGGHLQPGSILDQAEWVRTIRPDGTEVQTWMFPTVPGILTVGPIEFLPNSYLHIDFGNGGLVDPATGRGRAPGFPYPGGSAAWAADFADWQNQPGPERGLPPVDRTGYDQLRMTGDLVLNAAILIPNLQYRPLAWEAQFLIADFDGDGRVSGSLFQDRTFTIDGEDYVVRYDRGPNERSISFEAAGFTPVFRGLATPEAPVLIVARDLPVVAPSAPSPPQEPAAPPIDNLAAASEVPVGSERFVEVRVVTPIDDLGGVQETIVLRLPPEVLQDLRGLVQALPDDRYRVYLVVEHGQGRSSEEFLVREFYVREGKPVERDPQQARPLIPPSEHPPGESQTDPSNDEAQEGADQNGRSADEPMPVGAAVVGAVVVGTPGWQARVDRAIVQYAKRIPHKAIRRWRSSLLGEKGRTNEMS